MTVKVEGLGRLKSKFEDMFSKINSDANVRKLGFFIIEQIRVRTRDRGQGVKQPGGNPSKLKRVTRKYADWRKKQQRHPEAATGTSSNLAFRGTMLDKLIVRLATKKELMIGFKSAKEERKAEGQHMQGRRFLVLSKKEIRDAAEFVKSQLKAR